MNMQSKSPITPLRQRMIEDMAARKLGHHSQRSHLYSCKRFAAFVERSPETATADDIRRFQLFLIESGASICNRNRIMTGLRFLFRVTLRRHDLAAEIFHLKAPQKVPVVMSQDEIKRLLAMAANIKVRAMLSLAYGCGLRAGEVVRLKVGDLDRGVSEEVCKCLMCGFAQASARSLSPNRISNWLSAGSHSLGAAFQPFSMFLMAKYSSLLAA